MDSMNAKSLESLYLEVQKYIQHLFNFTQMQTYSSLYKFKLFDSDTLLHLKIYK